MKLEFLAEGSAECPLIRLFEFEPHEVTALRQACSDLAEGRLIEFAVSDQSWAQPINSCRFIWRASKKDIGVRLPTPDQPSVLECSKEAWREIKGKLSQFIEPHPDAFNWLSTEGDVKVLISTDGKW
jgi:hypothetical protein